MAVPSYDVRIDWNSDDDYTDTGEDVTSRVLERSGINVEFGRDQSRSLAPSRPGEAQFELNNTSRDYSPENASSPLAGNLGPGRPVRIQATHSAVTYTLYRGYLDDFELLPDIEHRSVELSALDGLARLRETKVSTALYRGIQTGEAVSRILDKVGWIAGRDLDVGASTLRWWWEQGTDAFTALTRIVTTEGPGAFIHIGANGEFIFRDRHHRLTRSASTSVQATFRDTGAEPLFCAPLVYDAGWRDIVNSVEFEVTEHAVRSTPDVIWQMYSQHQIVPGETKTFILVGNRNLFYDVITPTQTGTDPDFVISGSGTLTFTLDRTSGQEFHLSISLPLGGSAVTLLEGRLRGYVVDEVSTTKIRVENSTSISLHGRRSYSPDSPWFNANDAVAVANIILSQRSLRLPIIQLRIIGDGDTRLTQQLARDLSDRIRVIDAESGLDGEFFIDQVQHKVLSAGLVHETVFGCEKVPAQPASVFMFDVTGRGFDDGRFGQSGLDDPTTVFLFDHATQGQFDVGLFGN